MNNAKAAYPLFQASTYDLVWPVTRDGQEVPGTAGGRFTLFDENDEPVVEKTPDFDVEAQELSVRLDDSDTETLSGRVYFELWILDAGNNALAVRTGFFSIVPTLTRFN